MQTLNVNDKIQWSSAAGVLTGIIKNISLAKNSNDELIPWLDIHYVTSVEMRKPVGECRLCATDGYLKMMKVIKLT